MNKKLKITLLSIIIIVISIFLIQKINKITSERNISKMKESIISMYEKTYPDDKFYFMKGPDYNSDLGSTNIRYRGIISSDRLEKLGYYQGIEIGTEKYDDGVNVEDYKDTLEYLKFYLPLKEEAKKVFGNNLIFEINGTYTDEMDENIKNRMGTNMSRDEKTGLGVIVFTMFADDLEKDIMEKQDEWKEKMLAIGKKYWEYYNVTASMQLYIFERKLLYSHDLAWTSIGGIKDNDEKLKGYLERIRAGKKLNQEEEAYVLGRMGNNDLFIHISNANYNGKNVRFIDFGTDRLKIDEELNLENIKIITFVGRED
jgi:hypothetical protein